MSRVTQLYILPTDRVQPWRNDVQLLEAFACATDTYLGRCQEALAAAERLQRILYPGAGILVCDLKEVMGDEHRSCVAEGSMLLMRAGLDMLLASAGDRGAFVHRRISNECGDLTVEEGEAQIRDWWDEPEARELVADYRRYRRQLAGSGRTAT
jgi:hypothetical protein